MYSTKKVRQIYVCILFLSASSPGPHRPKGCCHYLPATCCFLRAFQSTDKASFWMPDDTLHFILSSCHFSETCCGALLGLSLSIWDVLGNRAQQTPPSLMSVLSNTWRGADVWEFPLAPSWNFLEAPSVPCSSCLSCLLFSSKASTTVSSGTCLGSLQCHICQLGVIRHHTTASLCNLLTFGKSLGISRVYSPDAISSQLHQLQYIN